MTAEDQATLFVLQGVVGFVLGLVILYLVARYLSGGDLAERRKVARYAEALGLSDEGLGFTARTLGGAFEGRVARVRLGVFGTTSFELAGVAPSLTVTRETPWTVLGKDLGLQRELETADAPFDRMFFLDSDDPRARTTLGDPVVRESIDRLFRDGVRRLAMGPSGFAATIPEETPPERCRSVMDQLARIAHAFAPVTVPVKVLAGDRVALRGQRLAGRCAYCHVDVDGTEADLVACERCRTVAHEGCWSELGRCPVLGCDGRSREGPLRT